MLGKRLDRTWCFQGPAAGCALRINNLLFLLTVAKAGGKPKGRGRSEEAHACNGEISDADYRCFAQALNSLFQRFEPGNVL